MVRAMSKKVGREEKGNDCHAKRCIVGIATTSVGKKSRTTLSMMEAALSSICSTKGNVSIPYDTTKQGPVRSCGLISQWFGSLCIVLLP